MSLDIVTEYRGISVETLEACGVYWEETDEWYPVRVPYRHKYGEWYERKLIDPRKRDDMPKGKTKVLHPAGKPPHLYNPLRLGPDADILFFCEGEYDTLSVIDAGYKAIGNQGASSFNRTWARLFGGSTNIFAYDGDSAGRKSAAEMAHIFKEVGNSALILDVGDDRDLNQLHQEGWLGELLEDFLADNEIIAYATDE